MELRSKTIVGRTDGPHLLIVGGVHGDEWEPMVAGRRLIRELDPTQLRGRVTICPCVNEAAFARGTRTADDMLDLARICPGKEEGTVSEQTAAAFAKLIRGADALIDMHTAGTIFNLVRLAGYGINPDPKIQETQRKLAHAFNFPLVWGTDGRFVGTSLSVARAAGIPSIYIENGGGGMCDPQRVEENVTGCLNALRAMEMLPGSQPPSDVKYFVEDDRINSGHLQGKCTATQAGYFQPEVALWDVVEKGQRVGRIENATGDESLPILAYTTGTVMLLRSFPSVKVGDPLIVILPVTKPGTYSYPNE